MIYIIYTQRFTNVHLKQNFDLIYINLYNLHLYLLIHLLYVLYSASIRHAGISAIEKQFYYYYYYYYVYVWHCGGDQCFTRSALYTGIGVTEGINQDELKSMVSKPTSTHFFTVDDFNQLIGVLENVILGTCAKQTTPAARECRETYVFVQ